MKELLTPFFALITALGFSGNVLAGGFDDIATGPTLSFDDDMGHWSAASGHIEIHKGNSRSGEQSLRILGGEKEREVELRLKQPTDRAVMFHFWAERWTARNPFEFTVFSRTETSDWTPAWDGKEVKIGGFKVEAKMRLPLGTTALRFVARSPMGVLLDDLSIQEEKPMVVTKVETQQPVVPILSRKKNNPVLGFAIHTEGSLQPNVLKSVEISLAGTTNIPCVRAIRIVSTGAETAIPTSTSKTTLFGEMSPETQRISGHHVLEEPIQMFWVMMELTEQANVGEQVDVGLVSITLEDGTVLRPEVVSPPGAQRIGVAVRLRGDDKASEYRIPGLATTRAGTLIAVYDVRRRNGADLPGDIDVGMSRSTDGGQTWEPMKIIMDMGNDPQWAYDGIGDPAILVDEKTGRIWVAATWSHGQRAWHGSGKGLTPEETGQWMLTHSDDDGKTWSKPVNITRQVKNPDYHYFLQGPGRGITLRDGTLVFAAQFRDGSLRPDGKKIAVPHSTLIWSRDRGQTWHSGAGVKSHTTEAQLIQLGDGTIMINCRDDRGGSRTIATTADLGKTWTLHPTDRKALPEPVCMASLLRVVTPAGASALFFSNPATTSGRRLMTIKASLDEGMTWPESLHTLYDARQGSGYSCLTPVGDDSIGVLYEGPNELYFLRFPIAELLKE